MSKFRKSLKIDDRLGRRQVRTEYQQDIEQQQDFDYCKCEIQQQSESQSNLSDRYNTKNQRNVPTQTQRQNNQLGNQQNLNKKENLYSNRIPLVLDLDQEGIRSKKKQQLKQQIKSMREMLYQLNNQVTKRINKYQVTSLTPKAKDLAAQTQKQYQVLLAKMQNNIKLIEIQERQITEVLIKERQISAQDYQLQLQQNLFLVQKAIRQRKKQKQQQGIMVGRLDHRLVRAKDADFQDQFKQIRAIKNNIFHYYKKYRENKAIIYQTDKKYKNMIQKYKILNKKYKKYQKFAQQFNLEVAANKNYMANKKIRDELVERRDYLNKKIDLLKRSKQQQCQKIQRDIQSLRKQINIVDKGYQVALSDCNQTIKNTDEYLYKNKIDLKLMSKISYKFSQITIKNSKQRSLNESTQPLEQIQTDAQQKKLESRLRTKMSNQSSSKGNGVISSNRYHTLGLELQPDKQKSIAANAQLLQLSKSRDKQFRVKAALHLKRCNKSSIDQSSLIKTNDASILSNDLQKNIRPRKLHKLLIKKDQAKQVI